MWNSKGFKEDGEDHDVPDFARPWGPDGSTPPYQAPTPPPQTRSSLSFNLRNSVASRRSPLAQGYQGQKMSSSGSPSFLSTAAAFRGRGRDGRRKEGGAGENVWKKLVCSGDLPGPRSGAASVVVGDKIYMFGGYGGSGRLGECRLQVSRGSFGNLSCCSQRRPLALELWN